MNWVKQVRKNIPGSIRNNYNFGCAQVDIQGLNKKEFFAHSGVGNLEDKYDMEKSLKPEASKNISRQPSQEDKLFETLKIDMKNNFDGPGEWDRTNDTDFKMFNEIASKLGGNTQVSGSIKMYTDLDCCPSCRYVIRQFEERYPNINIEVIFKTKVGGR